MVTTNAENTPLMTPIPPPPASPSVTTSPFYFLDNPTNSLKKGEDVTYDAVGSDSTNTTPPGRSTSPSSNPTSTSTLTADDSNGVEEEINMFPTGTSKDEFASRRVNDSDGKLLRQMSSKKVGFVASIFAKAGRQGEHTHNSILKQRKVPIKIEPKIFFANERTFLAWMHTATMLAGTSIAIVAFANANPFSELYGVMLLPVAIAFVAYALYQYNRRAKLIRLRDPGPYEDPVGPTVLCIMLMISIVANFGLKLYSITN